MADIQVDDGIFGLFGAKDPYSSAGQSLAVVTSDRAAAIQALVRVSQRWTLIGINGHEFATFDELLSEYVQPGDAVLGERRVRSRRRAAADARH